MIIKKLKITPVRYYVLSIMPDTLKISILFNATSLTAAQHETVVLKHNYLPIKSSLLYLMK